MIYRLTCPRCDAASEHPFVRLGAVTRCGGCGKTWSIEARHCERRTRSGEPAGAVSADWAVPMGAPAGKKGGGRKAGEERGVGPGSGLAVGEQLDRDGAAEVIVGMATLEDTLKTGGAGPDAEPALEEPAELNRRRSPARRGRGRTLALLGAGFLLAVSGTGAWFLWNATDRAPAAAADTGGAPLDRELQPLVPVSAGAAPATMPAATPAATPAADLADADADAAPEAGAEAGGR